MSGETWYSWQCPVCHAVGRGIVRKRSRCRRYGLNHLFNFHKEQGLEPLIKKITKSDKITSKIENLPTTIWIEIASFPLGVRPMDLLIIPSHIFIKKNVYKEIMEKGQGEK